MYPIIPGMFPDRDSRIPFAYKNRQESRPGLLTEKVPFVSCFFTRNPGTHNILFRLW
jgi:hypothetical protein